VSTSTKSYPYESESYPESESYTEKGMSLARGPALILGIVLSVAGLYSLYKQHQFPPFSHFPNGDVAEHKIFFRIFAANGWSGMLTAVAGMLLLIGAAQHLLAKTMSLIVGIALAVAAVIGLIGGNVLGMAASNIWTEILWGASAAILLLNTLAPRRTRTVVREPVPVQQPQSATPEPAAPAGPTQDQRPLRPEPVAAQEPIEDRYVGEDDRVTDRRPVGDSAPVAPRDDTGEAELGTTDTPAESTGPDDDSARTPSDESPVDSTGPIPAWRRTARED
jgi:Domain of unknown function (DUF4383)